jgi:hypothetical protein
MSLVQALAIAAAAYVTSLSLDGGFDSFSPRSYALSARAEAMVAREQARIEQVNALLAERYAWTAAPDACTAKYGRL